MAKIVPSSCSWTEGLTVIAVADLREASSSSNFSIKLISVKINNNKLRKIRNMLNMQTCSSAPWIHISRICKNVITQKVGKFELWQPWDCQFFCHVDGKTTYFSHKTDWYLRFTNALMQFDQYSCLAILFNIFRFSVKISKTNSKFEKKTFH